MTIEEIVRTVAKAKGLPLANFTVIMLERERHNEILAQLRKLGVRIMLIPDGDIAAAVVAAPQTAGRHAYWRRRRTRSHHSRHSCKNSRRNDAC